MPYDIHGNYVVPYEDYIRYAAQRPEGEPVPIAPVPPVDTQANIPRREYHYQPPAPTTTRTRMPVRANANTSWKLSDAQELVAAISAEVEGYGYQVCLGGSVLTKGKSDNDLDLFMIPASDEYRSSALLARLIIFWGEYENDGEEGEESNVARTGFKFTREDGCRIHVYLFE